MRFNGEDLALGGLCKRVEKGLKGQENCSNGAILVAWWWGVLVVPEFR